MAKYTSCNYCHKMILQSGQHECPNKPKRKVKATAEMTELEQLIHKYTKSGRWARKRDWIRKRDGEYCQRCWIKYGMAVTKDDAQLDVHHIYAVINMSMEQVQQLFFDDNNLVTVCHTCNMQLGTSNKLDFNWSPPQTEYHL